LGKQPGDGARTRWSDSISNLYDLGMEPAELFEIAVDCWAFLVLRLLPP